MIYELDARITRLVLEHKEHMSKMPFTPDPDEYLVWHEQYHRITEDLLNTVIRREDALDDYTNSRTAPPASDDDLQTFAEAYYGPLYED